MKQWSSFINDLRYWYHPDNRKLPWKGVRDPYLVWVSEIFLQQTQADRVVEFFLRFTARFPIVEKLAASSFEEALPYYRGLGYYGRLRRMIETARLLVEKHKGKFPKSVEELKKLPGIGEYTARAIASFAYGQRVIAPDTNVVRVVGRYFGKGLKGAKGKSWVMENLEWLDEQYPKDLNLNQALMDLGAGVCNAKAPKCGECPLVKQCAYGKDPVRFSELEEKFRRLPRSARNDAKPRSLRGYRKVVVGILIQDKRVLVSRRKADQTYAGLLEFPGGKVEAGEDERRAMQREFREEVGVEVSVRPPFTKIVQVRKKQVLYFHRCRILTGEPKSMEGQEVFWIPQEELDPDGFMPANKGVIQQLKGSRL